MTVANEVFDLFQRQGQKTYFGESVSVLDHSLQAAWFAHQAGAAPPVVAALLHDIGHLLHGLPEDIAQRDIDGRHEVAGEAWLAPNSDPKSASPFGYTWTQSVISPLSRKEYLAALSPSSLLSLRLQGGPFTSDQVHDFEGNAYFNTAMALRRWRDAAKMVDLVVPELTSYLEQLNACGR